MDVGDPVAHRLVHRVLQRAGAGGHRHHLGPQQFHAKDVGLLPLHIGRAHVDDAFQAEQRAHGGCRDAVLAGAGLGEDALRAHPASQQDLTQAVVRFVRTGMVQFVTLEIDFRAAQFVGEAAGEPEGAGAADIVRQMVFEVGVERRIGFRRVIGGLDFQDQRHQRLGHEAAAVLAEAAAVVGSGAQAVGDGRTHAAGSPDLRRLLRADRRGGKAPNVPRSGRIVGPNFACLESPGAVIIS